MVDLEYLRAIVGASDPGGMSDAQLAALIAAIAGVGGTIVGAIKWAVGRVTKALDDNAAAHIKTAEAQIKLAESLTTMAHELREARDEISDARADIASVRGFVEEHTPVGGTRLPDEHHARPTKRSTPVRGVPSIIERHRTRGGDDKR